MFKFNSLTLLSALVILGSISNQIEGSDEVIQAALTETTAAPAIAAASAPVVIVTTSQPGAKGPEAVAVVEPGVKAAVVAETTSAPASAADESQKSSQLPQQTIEHLIKMITSDHADPSEPIHKFCDFLKPICETMDKIDSKCTTKIQSQMKQMVQVTNGKLSSCFADHYSFNPITGVLTKSELAKICESKNLTADAKGSYKSFQHCAAKVWSPAVDKEIDKIQLARLEYLRKNQHIKDNSASMLAHESDENETRLINDVVNKVLAADGNSPSANVKVVNVVTAASVAASTTTAAPKHPPPVLVAATEAPAVVASAIPTTIAPAVVAAEVSKAVKADAKDPLIVIVNEDTTGAPKIASVSTAAPVIIAISTAAPVTSAAPATTAAPAVTILPASTSAPVSTATPAVTAAIDASTSSKPKIVAVPSVGPVIVIATSTKAPAAEIAHSSSTSKPVEASTAKPAEIKSVVAAVTTKAPERKSNATTVAAEHNSTTTTTVKPGTSEKPTKKIEIVKTTKETMQKIIVSKTTVKPAVGSSSTIKSVVIKHDSSTTSKPSVEKAEKEKKLRDERERMLKLLKKNQDELDALTAVKSLQAQRQKVAEHDHSDNRVHQLEHHRQMVSTILGNRFNLLSNL